MLKKTVEDLNYKTNILTSCLSAFYQYSKKNNNILQYEGSAGEEDLKEANGLPTDNVTDNYYYPIFVVLFNYIRKWGNEDRFIAQKPLLKQLNELVIEEISDYGG